jgi:hypothetical protein
MDAALLQLCLVAIVAFPIALPQMTSLITGLAVDSPAFLQRQTDFLRRIGELLRAPEKK